MADLTFTSLTRRVEIGANSSLLEIAGRRIVVDSGLHPKYDGEEALPQMERIGDDTADAIILTHAHQDHVGSLPLLMRRHLAPGLS